MDRDVRDKFRSLEKQQHEYFNKAIRKADDIIFLGQIAGWICAIGVAMVLGVILFY